MNVRRPIDYSDMLKALDALVAADMPQMELYCSIGKVVCSRPEKGAVVAVSEYLHRAYPGTTGFSPRNLRRMRKFYQTYERTPTILAEAMTIGWTQKVVIFRGRSDSPGEAVVHQGGTEVRLVQVGTAGEDQLRRPCGSTSRLPG